MKKKFKRKNKQIKCNIIKKGGEYWKGIWNFENWDRKQIDRSHHQGRRPNERIVLKRFNERRRQTPGLFLYNDHSDAYCALGVKLEGCAYSATFCCKLRFETE